MIRLDEIVVVEGKHDIDAVRRVADATVIDTNGFGIFTDRALLATLRDLASRRGVIILTDSDAAGFAIRRRVADAVGQQNVKHVYIPDVYGKERRKAHPSKEGKLGVEGMSDEVLLQAFERAGVTSSTCEKRRYLTKAVLYEDGLSGHEGSREKCRRLKQKLGLPERLSSNRLADVLNVLLTEDEYRALVADITEETT